MKLLLDENLSRRLVPFLQAEFPDSTQVALAGLERATDLAIWTHAKDHGYVIATRDADLKSCPQSMAAHLVLSGSGARICRKQQF